MSAELVGPLPVIRFADDSVQAYDVPRNTMDIRYAACTGHHPACDCREALLAEDIGEYRMMLRQAEDAILAAIKGHQTWAYTAYGQLDEFAQCKCQACAIARAAHVGRFQCMRETRENADRLEAERIERNAAHGLDPLGFYLDEVPF